MILLGLKGNVPVALQWGSITLNVLRKQGDTMSTNQELVEKLLKAFCDTSDMHMSYRELAVIAAKEIQRLLADEREKVRETCANAVSQRAGELRDLLKTICASASVITNGVGLTQSSQRIVLVAFSYFRCLAA